jgi:hypothetical protein
MIGLFPAGEPLRVTITADWVGSRNGALIGFTIHEGELLGLIVDEKGNVVRVERSDFTVDWRYDVETDRWVDVNTRQTDQDL